MKEYLKEYLTNRKKDYICFMNHTTRPLLLDEAQTFADKHYAYRKINNHSGPSQDTVEDVAEKFPLLTNDEINDIVFNATVNFQEK